MSGKVSHQPQQRIRIGLTGLAFVFVLVMLGAAISRSSQDGQPVTTTVNQMPGEPNEPLAEIGAAPGQSQADNSANAAAAPRK